MNSTQVYFKSDEVSACIVTCGGLCPGLNTVIREIVHSLDYMYGVNAVLGIDVSSLIFKLLLMTIIISFVDVFTKNNCQFVIYLCMTSPEYQTQFTSAI